MTGEKWIRISGTLMTSETISAYGGISFPPPMLESIAKQVSGSAMTWHVDHDHSKPIRIRDVSAFMEERVDGIDLLKFGAEIHPEDFDLVGSRLGLSMTIGVPLERDLNRSTDESTSRLLISADHAWFEDDALIEAETLFVERGIGGHDLMVERAYQFGAVPDPQIFTTVIYPMLISLGAGALWDGLKLIFRRRRTPVDGDSSAPTTLNVSIVDGKRSITAVVSTHNEDVAQRAIEALEGATEAFFANAAAEDESKEVVVPHDHFL